MGSWTINRPRPRSRTSTLCLQRLRKTENRGPALRAAKSVRGRLRTVGVAGRLGPKRAEQTVSSIIISNTTDISVIDAVKRIAEQNRAELGFHARQAYVDSLNKGELLIARVATQVVGFARYHHRRDNLTTLYEIGITPHMQGKGIGHRLIDALIDDCQRMSSRCLRLSCPVELPANQFYRSLGFVRSTYRSRLGRSRPLYEWKFPILPDRKITFVASLTSRASDLDQLIQMWEREGPSRKPFEKCNYHTSIH